MNSKKIMQARNLRKHMTDAEIKLWQELRYQQMNGVRFRRQVPIGKYIVDFASHEIRFIIELDGGQHNESPQIKYDNGRTRWLESQGYKIKRFWDHEVLTELDDVLAIIWDICNQRPPS